MLVEVALAIELLLMTGLRIKNLSGLHLDRSIEWSRAARTGTCLSVFWVISCLLMRRAVRRDESTLFERQRGGE